MNQEKQLSEENPEYAFTQEMQEVFYAEELEDRFETAPVGPNGVCWELQPF